MRTSMFKSFLRNEQGASIIMVGVMILTLIVATGIAVDMGRAQLVKNKMSAALDAAALAAASRAQTEDMNITARKYFLANFPPGYMGAQMGTINVQSSQGFNTVRFSLDGSVNTSFLRIVGINDVPVHSFVEVLRITKNGLELVMVLDNTGSMNPALNGGTDKIGQLKTATKQMVDLLYEDKESLDDVYVSLVSFNTHVNIGVSRNTWLTNPNPPSQWQGCVHEPRSGDSDSTDLPPTGTTGSKFAPYLFNEDVAETSDECLPAIAPHLSTKANIKAALNNMFAHGATRTDIGTVWGWRLLSPRWRGLWGVNAELPLNYDDGTSRKALILLTDGDNTAYDADGQLDQSEINSINAKQVKLCNKLKENGVRIYAVAFAVTSEASTSTIKNILRGCASKPEYYFDAPDGPQLIKAFRDIADNLLSLRLSR